MDPPLVPKRRQTQPQPQLLMRVVPFSTTANGESKDEAGEHITSVCRKDGAVEEEVGIYGINQFCCFYIHPPLSRNWGKRKRERKRREETRTLIDTNDNTYLLPNSLEKSTHTVAIRRMSWLDDTYLRRILRRMAPDYYKLLKENKKREKVLLRPQDKARSMYGCKFRLIYNFIAWGKLRHDNSLSSSSSSSSASYSSMWSCFSPILFSSCV